MKIVMLGHSGAGKTTYLSLMYAEMLDGIAGFHQPFAVITENREELRSIVLAQCCIHGARSVLRCGKYLLTGFGSGTRACHMTEEA